MIVEQNYNLVSLEQKSEDVTAKYNQTNSVLDDLREREARLKKDLENQKLETSDTLNIERELAEVQIAVRNAEKQQSVIDDGVLYSTINVILYEVIFREEIVEEVEEPPEIPEPEFGERLGETAAGSINGFIAFCQNFLLVLIRIAPAVLIIAVFAFLALLIYRGVRKYQRKHKKAIPEPTVKTDDTDRENPAE